MNIPKQTAHTCNNNNRQFLFECACCGENEEQLSVHFVTETDDGDVLVLLCESYYCRNLYFRWCKTNDGWAGTVKEMPAEIEKDICGECSRIVCTFHLK